MINVDVSQLLKDAGAITNGHYLLSSGRHSDRYVEKFHLLRHPSIASDVVQSLASRFNRLDFDVVVGPTTGGILLAFELGRQLGLPTAYAERIELGSPVREFRRGTAFDRGTRVLVIDDILTTGGSIRETLDALEPLPVVVKQIVVIIDRSGGRVNFGDVPHTSSLQLDFESWAADDCPLCAKGVPLAKPGTTAVS